MPFTNPIVAGITLIRTAIRSPDFVTGVSGWCIFKNGSAEFNDLDARGSIEAGNGNVRLNASGIHVGDGSGDQFDINFAAGFLARADPDDGRSAQMTVLGGTTAGGFLGLSVPDPSAVNGTVFDNGAIFVDTTVNGAVDTPILRIDSPNVTGKDDANIVMSGVGSDDTPSAVEVFADRFEVHGIGRVEYLAVPGPVNATNTVAMINIPGSVLTIPAGATCIVETYAAYDGPVAADARWAWAKSSANVIVDRNILAPAAGTATNIDTNIMMIRRGDATQQVTGTPAGVANAFSVYAEWAIATNSGATDELIQLQISQGTANVAPTIFKSGYIRMTRVG